MLLDPLMLSKGNKKWIDVLEEAMKRYQNRRHSTIKMTPVQAQRPQNQEILKNTIYSNLKIFTPPKFREGQYVRISRHKALFEKKTGVNWSYEIFKVRKVHLTNPRCYQLSDLNGEPILGRFNEFELNSTKYPFDYLLEKIIKKKGDKTLVKWLGFKEPTYILTKNIIN